MVANIVKEATFGQKVGFSLFGAYVLTRPNLTISSFMDTVDYKISKNNPISNHKMKRGEQKITSYCEALNSKDFASSKIKEIPEFEDIEKYAKENPKAYDKNRIYRRVCDGYRIACHVFAYLSGKDGLFNDVWPKVYKICANTICNSLRLPNMYKIEENKSITDYGIDNDTSKPILTSSICSRAFIEFPVEMLGKVFANKELAEPVEGEIIEPDNVIEVEQDMIKNGVINPKDPTIIDVDPKDLKETPIKPIFDMGKMDVVLNADEVPTKELTVKQNEHIQEWLGKYLEGRSYQLNRIPQGGIELAVTGLDGNFSYRYWIDPNMYIGNGYNIIGYAKTDNPEIPIVAIPVNELETEIVEKLMTVPDYTLSEEDVNKCYSHMFKNNNIYNIVDMSNMSRRLEKLSPEDFEKFGQKLTFIINSLTPEMRGRLRIDSYKSIDDFTMVSDLKCKTPFPWWSTTNVSGVKLSIKGDTVTATINGTSNDIVIKYDV